MTMTTVQEIPLYWASCQQKYRISAEMNTSFPMNMSMVWISKLYFFFWLRFLNSPTTKSAIAATPIASVSRCRFSPLNGSGMKPLPSALKNLLLTMIVPLPSVMRRSAPRKMNMLARDATNEGTPIEATSHP